MTEQADKDKKQNLFKRHKILTAVTVIVLLLFLIPMAAPKTIINNHAPTTAQNVEKTVDTSLPPPPPKVLLDQSGNGDAQTKPFTASGDWTMAYTYNCSSNDGNGVFAVNISNADGSTNNDTGPDEDGASGGTTDYYYDAGQHYLQIDSDCSWTITIKG